MSIPDEVMAQLNGIIARLNAALERLEADNAQLLKERDEARGLVCAACQGTDLYRRRSPLQERYPWLLKEKEETPP